MKNELELLNKIKKQLLSKGEIFSTPNATYKHTQNATYKLIISADNWHEIFKTDEYNELKQPPKNQDPPIQKRT